MSGENVTSVLLPSSSIDFFLLDEKTSALVDKLKDDWRFARVNISMNSSAVDSAVQHYEEFSSPELIVIETDDMGEAFLEKLESLSGVCSEGTDAIVIGPSNDVHLYRSLVEMGVKDYLVRPVDEEDLIKVLAKALIEKRGFSGSRLVTIIGSKGGVGTTAISQIIAGTIADILKQKTIILDIAGTSGNMGVIYSLEPSTSLTEAVRLGPDGSEEDMDRIYQHASDNLSLLLCGADSIFNDIPDKDNVEILVKRLMKRFPVVVIDLSGTSRSVQKRLIELSSETILVSTPMIAPLRNARTLINELKDMKHSLDSVNLILNMTGRAASEEVPLNDINAALGIEPKLSIAYNSKLFLASETEAKSIIDSVSAEKIINDIMPLAEKISNVKNNKSHAKPQSGMKAFLNKILGQSDRG